MALTSSRRLALDQTHHNALVERHIHSFSWDNPLGVSPWLHYTLAVYAPVLVVLGCGLNLFAGWVLESVFLRDLTARPLLALLLKLNTLLLLSGPLYVWVVQVLHIYIHQDQIFHCFLLNLTNNFALLSSAFVLIAIVVERCLAIGRRRSSWATWRKTCTDVGALLLQAAVIIALAELCFLDLGSITSAKKFPICLPWWESDKASAPWFKLLAVLFSVAPSFVIMASLLALEICTARFNLLVKVGQDSLPEYQALLLELTTAVHLKFANSATFLGFLFLLLAAPLGLFILLGPVFHIRTSGVLSYDNEKVLTVTPGNGTDAVLEIFRSRSPRSAEELLGNGSVQHQLLSGSHKISVVGHNFNSSHWSIAEVVGAAQDSIHPLHSWEYRYLLISRGDAETIMWFLRYSFCLLTIPVLLYTEVLFSREWMGRLRQVSNVLCCRRRRSAQCLPRQSGGAGMPGSGFPWRSELPASQLDDAEARVSGSVAGPYIARVEETSEREAVGERAGKSRSLGLRSQSQARNIKIFDASKPVRAGRPLPQLGANKSCPPSIAIDGPDRANTDAPGSTARSPPGRSPFLHTLRKALSSIPKFIGVGTPKSGTADDNCARSTDLSKRRDRGREDSDSSSSTWDVGHVRRDVPPAWRETRPALKVRAIALAAAPVAAGLAHPTVVREERRGQAAMVGTAPPTRVEENVEMEERVRVENGVVTSGLGRGQTWDYQLLAQLAAVDSRRRNFFSTGGLKRDMDESNPSAHAVGGGARSKGMFFGADRPERDLDEYDPSVHVASSGGRGRGTSRDTVGYQGIASLGNATGQDPAGRGRGGFAARAGATGRGRIADVDGSVMTPGRGYKADGGAYASSRDGGGGVVAVVDDGRGGGRERLRDYSKRFKDITGVANTTFVGADYGRSLDTGAISIGGKKIIGKSPDGSVISSTSYTIQNPTNARTIEQHQKRPAESFHAVAASSQSPLSERASTEFYRVDLSPVRVLPTTPQGQPVSSATFNPPSGRKPELPKPPSYTAPGLLAPPAASLPRPYFNPAGGKRQANRPSKETRDSKDGAPGDDDV